MAKLLKKIRLLHPVSLGVFIVILLGMSGFVAKSAIAQQAFSFNPTSYNIEISSLGEISLQFDLKNESSIAYNFSLEISSDDAKRLADKGLELEASLQTDPTQIDLTKAKLPIKMEANSQEKLKLKLTSKLVKDYNLKLPVKLTQTESQRRLSKSNYDIELDIKSELAQAAKTSETQRLWVMAGIAGLVVLVVVIFLISRFRRSRSDQSSEQL